MARDSFFIIPRMLRSRRRDFACNPLFVLRSSVCELKSELLRSIESASIEDSSGLETLPIAI